MQYEDYLEQLGRKEGKGEDGFWLRYTGDWETVAGLMGVKSQRLKSDDNGSRNSRTWWMGTVLPLMKQGNAFMMSIKEDGGKEAGSHIVRVQWVEEQGLRIDDPNGRLNMNTAADTFKIASDYDENPLGPFVDGSKKRRSETSGVKGENNLWPWTDGKLPIQVYWVSMLSKK
jgi:hypothetical protein